MTQHNFNCPHCNKQLSVGPSGISQHSPLTPWTPLAEFQNVSQGPLSGPAGAGLVGEWQKVTPLGRLSAKDVGTTLLDSTIVFGLVSVSLGLICHLARLPWLVGPSVGLFCGAVRYLYGISHTQGLLTVVESWRSAEPKAAGPLQQPGPVVTVEIRNGKRWEYAFLGVEPGKLCAFAEALLDGAPFTEDQAKKHSITQAELKQIREEFINRGLARWNNAGRPQMGITLARSCYTVLQGIVDSTQQQAAGE